MAQREQYPIILGETSARLSKCTVSESPEMTTRYQLLDEDGEYDSSKIPDLSDDDLIQLYTWMIRQQVVDDRMVKLQRRGEMGTYASGRGHEASIAAAAYALEDQDWLFPYGREATAMLIKGMPLRDLMLYWRGVEDANKQGEHNLFPPAIAIGTHVPVGVGVGWGMRLAGTEGVSVVFHGDGHPSTGEYQAGANFAGVVDAQTLFYCQNNGYSISMPFDGQTAAATVSQKAIAWGMEGIRVDGNDPLAVYDAVRTARDRVLEGKPTIVESVTYRLDAHTTNDDPKRYRTDEEVDWWEHRDPLKRYQSFLEAEGLWDRIDASAVVEDANEWFDLAKQEADEYDQGGVEEMFKYVFEDLPEELQQQFTSFEAFLEARPDAFDYIEDRPKW